MKRFLMLGACALLCSSLVARAEVLYVYNTNDMSELGTINVTRTDMLDGRDQLLLTLATITGAGAGGGISNMFGTWTPTAGVIFVPKGMSSSLTTGLRKWGVRTTVNGADQAGDLETSWINFSTINGTLVNATGQYKTTPTPPLVPFETFNRSGTWNPAASVLQWTAHDSDFLKGAWYGDVLSPTAPEGFNDLATLYVTSGSSVQYNGALGYTAPNMALPVLITTQIPEPATLVLLATGLLGLVCYAWRKRK